MTAAILDGKYVSSQIKKKIHQQIASILQQDGTAPGLAVIMLGDDLASTVYVQNKRAACEAVGIQSYAYDLPADTSQQALSNLIHRLNESNEVHGILIQLPLPEHIDTNTIIESIHPDKDVDGFHPYNLGRLAQKNPALRPCTPYGIMQLLEHYQLDVSGKHAVVVGASNIVGRPMALELLLAKATVTICHKLTPNLEPHIRSADIIVVATGIPDLIHSDWFNSNQVLIDVGIHRNKEGKLRGDIDFKAAQEKAAWITPVPGGVGPMTITALLQNTMQAYVKSNTKT